MLHPATRSQQNAGVHSADYALRDVAYSMPDSRLHGAGTEAGTSRLGTAGGAFARCKDNLFLYDFINFNDLINCN